MGKLFSHTTFFVDRDLSDFIPDGRPSIDNLYVTDSYSIENDTVNTEVLRRTLLEVLGVGMLEPEEWRQISGAFEVALSEFCNSLEAIMAQFISWLRKGHRPMFNDVDVRKFFVFSGLTMVLAD